MKRTPILILTLALFLAACTGNPTGSVTPTPSAPTASPIPPTAPAPTDTPAPGIVLFFAPDPAAAQVITLHAQVAQLATTGGMVVEDLTALAAADFSPDVRIAILLAVPPDLDALLTAAPKVQFVVVGAAASLDSKPNLSVIQQQAEQAAFLAGFVATIISSDWRSAALLPDTPAGLAEAFQNGGRYYCGYCSSRYGPVTLFPLVTALPAGSALSAWQDGLAQMQTRLLETLYIDPTISTPELLAALSNQTLVLVGGLPPADDLRPRWAATVSADLVSPLKTLWPDLLAGAGGKTLPASLQLSDVNENLLTPGKQRLAQDVIAGLQDGSIAPLSPP
jgi:hypothetical protein